MLNFSENILLVIDCFTTIAPFRYIVFIRFLGFVNIASTRYPWQVSANELHYLLCKARVCIVDTSCFDDTSMTGHLRKV